METIQKLERWLSDHAGCWCDVWVSTGGTWFAALGHSGVVEPVVEAYASNMIEAIGCALTSWENDVEDNG